VDTRRFISAGHQDIMRSQAMEPLASSESLAEDVLAASDFTASINSDLLHCKVSLAEAAP
jgi:hypothetical protein